MKVVFVIPVYNDWNSLKILSKQIKEVSVKEKWNETELIIVNDASSQELNTSPNPFALKTPPFPVPQNEHRSLRNLFLRTRLLPQPEPSSNPCTNVPASNLGKHYLR